MTPRASAVALVLVVLSACRTSAGSADEMRKFDAVRNDPMLNEPIAGASAEPVAGNAGHGGDRPTSARAFREWRVSRSPVDAAVDALDRAQRLGVHFEQVTCGVSDVTAGGSKIIGDYVGSVTIGVNFDTPPLVQIALTVAGGPDAPRPPLRSAETVVDPKCPPQVRAAVR